MATSHDPTTELQNLSNPEIREIARAYFGQRIPVESVTCEFMKLDVTSIGTGTIDLIKATGTALVSGKVRPWSSIVKIVEPEAESSLGGSDPTSSVWSEIHTYQQKLFELQSSRFRGAKCYKVDDRGNGQLWIWMEDLSEYSGSNWSKAEYVLAANGIGQFKSEWLQKSTSKFDWLPKHSRATELDNDELLVRNHANFLRLQDSDYFREALPGPSYERLVAMRKLIPGFMRAVQQVPNTLSHNDCHIRNLFAAPDLSEVVCIDFARVAVAPVGMDGGDLLGSSFMWTDPEAITAIGAADEIYHSWREGLLSSGNVAPDHVVRFAFLFPILRRAIAVPGMLAWVALGESFPLRRYGGSKDEMPLSFRKRFEFLLPLIDEATVLADQINS